MNVVSLFDGISCAMVALQKANIAVKSYRAYEIDKYAVAVSKKNYPHIQHYGNVKELKEKVECDLLIGGSPCQDLSIAKKGREGLEGDRSSLFWEYVRIKNLLQPKWFVLENVASMSQKDREIITKTMGVEPIMIDAALVSAQRRKRLFWTNLPVSLPEDKGIVVRDILLDDVDEKYYIKTELPKNNKAQAYRVYPLDGKTPSLMSNGGGVGAKTGLYSVGRILGRRLKDGKRADDDTSIETKQVLELSVDQHKTGTLTNCQKDNVVVKDERIRRLTPIECERLQGLPDNYTASISDTQRYKCCGNAFNTDVISHIFSFIPK